MIDSLLIHADRQPGAHRLPDDFWLWLPILGPSSILTLQFMTDQLHTVDHAQLDLADLARRLGHHNSVERLMKSLRRLHDFRCIQLYATNVATVRMELPAVHPKTALRLPADLVPAYCQMVTDA